MTGTWRVAVTIINEGKAKRSPPWMQSVPHGLNGKASCTVCSYPSSQPDYVWRLPASRVVPKRPRQGPKSGWDSCKGTWAKTLLTLWMEALSLLFPSHTELSTGFWNLESWPTPEHRVLTGIPGHIKIHLLTPPGPGRECILCPRLLLF